MLYFINEAQNREGGKLDNRTYLKYKQLEDKI